MGMHMGNKEALLKKMSANRLSFLTSIVGTIAWPRPTPVAGSSGKISDRELKFCYAKAPAVVSPRPAHAGKNIKVVGRTYFCSLFTNLSLFSSLPI